MLCVLIVCSYMDIPLQSPKAFGQMFETCEAFFGPPIERIVEESCEEVREGMRNRYYEEGATRDVPELRCASLRVRCACPVLNVVQACLRTYFFPPPH